MTSGKGPKMRREYIYEGPPADDNYEEPLSFTGYSVFWDYWYN